MKHDFEGWIQSQGWSPVADDRVSACSAVVLQPFVFELTPSVEILKYFSVDKSTCSICVVVRTWH